MSRKLVNLSVFALAGVTMAACAGVDEIGYSVDDAFFSPVPTCIRILPAIAMPENDEHAINAGRSVRSAFQRHFSVRFSQVKLEDQPSGTQKITGPECGHELQLGVTSGNIYAGVFASRTLEVKATLVRVVDEVSVWQGDTAVARGAGGLPLEPISIATSAASALAMASDADLTASLADDAVRRIARTIPIDSR